MAQGLLDTDAAEGVARPAVRQAECGEGVEVELTGLREQDGFLVSGLPPQAAQFPSGYWCSLLQLFAVPLQS